MVGENRRFLKYNGALGSDQRDWLDSKLAQADAADQKVVVISQFPLRSK